MIPDRNKAADLGISMAEIGQTINAAIGGERVGQVQGRRPALRHPRAPARPSSASGRRTSSACSCARRRGALVRLGDIVRIEQQPTLQAITRKDRERAITIFANVRRGASQAEALDKALQIARGRACPRATAPSPPAAARPSRSRSPPWASPS